jgi:hypothetical protein
MAPTSDPMRDLLLDCLAEKVGDLSPHINAERVASDLALVRWAAEAETARSAGLTRA